MFILWLHFLLILEQIATSIQCFSTFLSYHGDGVFLEDAPVPCFLGPWQISKECTKETVIISPGLGSPSSITLSTSF